MMQPAKTGVFEKNLPPYGNHNGGCCAGDASMLMPPPPIIGDSPISRHATQFRALSRLPRCVGLHGEADQFENGQLL